MPRALISCAVFSVVVLFSSSISVSSMSITHQLMIVKSSPMEHSKPPEVAEAVDTNSQDALDDTAGVGKNKKKWHAKFRFVENFFSSLLMIFFTDPDTLRIAAKICSWTTWTFVALSTFGTIGFDTKPFLSLLSVFGLTIGFAAKDILTNIFKGFYVLFTRPFKRGWIISVNGFRGKITSIDGRYVTLHSLIDKSETLVPLSMIYDTAIVVERKLDA